MKTINNQRKRFFYFLAVLFFVTGCQPSMTDSLHPADNVATIAAALKRLQLEGNNRAYAVFIADDVKNYYVQAGNTSDTSTLLTEAVSNQYLEAQNKLQAGQIATLRSIGWHAPEKGVKNGIPNYYREWKAIGDEERLAIAKNLVDTLIKVYGFNGAAKITVKMDLRP